MPIKGFSKKRRVDAGKVLRFGLDGRVVVGEPEREAKIRLSHSQLSMVLRCSKQWYFAYGLGLRRPPSGAMMMGSAFHDGQEVGFNRRKTIGIPMRTVSIADAYSDSFDRRAREEIKWGAEDRGKLKDEGYALTQNYSNHFAHRISPSLVEHRDSVVIGDVEMRLVIDVVDREGLAIELKTTGRTWFDAENSIQHYPYLWYLSRLTDGKKPWEMDFAYHVNFRGPARRRLGGKEVKPEEMTKVLRVNPTKRSFGVWCEQLFSARKQIEAGIFPPRTADTGNFLCSEKYCGYWDLCVGRGRTVIGT